MSQACLIRLAMRECWISDIADFAKYGLLKRLAGNDLRLGVLWYLTTHARPNQPLVSYLSRPTEYKAYDSELFDALLGVHRSRPTGATLVDIEQRGVLPAGTLFHGAPLRTGALARKERGEARRQWFESAFAATAEASLVFLDPDTGLPAWSTRPKRRR